MHHQTQGLLGGPVTRGQQLLVQVQERHQVGVLGAVQHRFGADQDPSAGGGTVRPVRRRPP